MENNPKAREEQKQLVKACIKNLYTIFLCELASCTFIFSAMHMSLSTSIFYSETLRTLCSGVESLAMGFTAVMIGIMLMFPVCMVKYMFQVATDRTIYESPQMFKKSIQEENEKFGMVELMALQVAVRKINAVRPQITALLLVFFSISGVVLMCAGKSWIPFMLMHGLCLIVKLMNLEMDDLYLSLS